MRLVAPSTVLGLIFGASLTALSGCTGDVTGPLGGGGQGPGTPGAPGGSGSPAGAAGAGASVPGPAQMPLTSCDKKDGTLASAQTLPLRRLNRTELSNTVRDLFSGKAKVPAPATLPSDALAESGFVEGGSIAVTDAQRLLQLAEATVQSLGDGVTQLAACDAATAEKACAEKLVRELGRRAFRRPVDQSTVDRYTAYYERVRTELSSSHEDAMRLVVQVMLQSPELLYHRQIGKPRSAGPDGAIRLDAHELAARLSYFLWSTLPDATLFSAAESGTITSPAGLRAEAERLLKDPKAAAAIGEFHLHWLKMERLPEQEKSPEEFPQFTPQLRAAMLAQLQRFSSEAVLSGGGLKELLTGSHTYVNAELAPLYGLSQAGPDLVRVPLDATQRRGILTLPGFLAAQSTGTETLPPRMGSVLYRNVLCQTLPTIPPVVPPVKPPEPGLTTRERFAEHSTNPCARGCHQLLDPLGFAFEHYDAIGRYRETEHGEPVDASGSLRMPDGTTLAFTDAIGLITGLADSPVVHECMARQWTRYAWGRPEVAGDSASFCGAFEQFKSSGLDVRELLISLVTSPAFLERAPSAGEPIQ